MGYNCAESTNFATESWLKFGAEAKSCSCPEKVASVVIDMSIFLHKANPKAKKAILSHLPQPSSEEDHGSVQESASPASSGAECCQSASIDDDSGSQATAPAATKRGRKPALSGPGKRRRSPDAVSATVSPPRKRGRMPKAESSKAGLGKPATGSKAPLPLHSPKAADAVETKKKPHETNHVVLGNTALRGAAPTPKLRRGSVAMVATTSLTRRVGRPGSRQRVLAMLAARKTAGISWGSVKRKLPKRPVGASPSPPPLRKASRMSPGASAGVKKGPLGKGNPATTTELKVIVEQGVAKKRGRLGRPPFHSSAASPKPANLPAAAPDNGAPAGPGIKRKCGYLRGVSMSDQGQSLTSGGRRPLAQSNAQAGSARKSRRLGLSQQGSKGDGLGEQPALSSSLGSSKAQHSSKVGIESAASPPVFSKMKAGKGGRAARFSLRRASLQLPKAAAPPLLSQIDSEVPSTPTKRIRVDVASSPRRPAIPSPRPKQTEVVPAVAVGRVARKRTPTYKVAGT